KVFFTGYDEDQTTRDPLGNVEESFASADSFGVGSHVVKSSNGSYTLHYRIVVPGSRRLRVRFQSIDVKNDEDTAGSGELFFEGTVHTRSTGMSPHFDVGSGLTVPLSGSQWSVEVLVPPRGTLRVSLTGFDQDVYTIDPLGDVDDTYDEQQNWGIGSHATK